jgi:hypothetical protein
MKDIEAANKMEEQVLTVLNTAVEGRCVGQEWSISDYNFSKS